MADYRVEIDPTLPPDAIELRADDGNVVGRIIVEEKEEEACP